jgi:tetratricopeptide (TPR) repeat protein
MSAERIEKLQAMLAQSPNDAFLLYAMGMERKKTGPAEALKLFSRVIEIDPNHGYAYFQLGQTHESTGDTAAARVAYRDGMAAAQRGGDHHAAGEISAALEMLE